jgi:hypothetical protein
MMGLFAAVHESGFGPSRHFAAAQQLVALGGIADIGSGQKLGCRRPDVASLI